MSNVRRLFNLMARGNKVGTMNESTRKTWVERALKELPPGLRLLDAGAGEQRSRLAR